MYKKGPHVHSDNNNSRDCGDNDFCWRPVSVHRGHNQGVELNTLWSSARDEFLAYAISNRPWVLLLSKHQSWSCSCICLWNDDLLTSKPPSSAWKHSWVWRPGNGDRIMMLIETSRKLWISHQRVNDVTWLTGPVVDQESEIRHYSGFFAMYRQFLPGMQIQHDAHADLDCQHGYLRWPPPKSLEYLQMWVDHLERNSSTSLGAIAAQ